MISKINFSLPKSELESQLVEEDEKAENKSFTAAEPKTLAFELMFDGFENHKDFDRSANVDRQVKVEQKDIDKIR